MTSIWMSAGVVPVRHRISALVLVSVLVALVPVAHASPPDPTWLPGIYDGGDFDEVVAAVVSATAVGNMLLLFPKPAHIPTGIVRPADVAFVATAPFARFHIRAPPFRSDSVVHERRGRGTRPL